MKRPNSTFHLKAGTAPRLDLRGMQHPAATWPTLHRSLGSGLISACSRRAVRCEQKGESAGSEFPLRLHGRTLAAGTCPSAAKRLNCWGPGGSG